MVTARFFLKRRYLLFLLSFSLNSSDTHTHAHTLRRTHTHTLRHTQGCLPESSPSLGCGLQAPEDEGGATGLSPSTRPRRDVRARFLQSPGRPPSPVDGAPRGSMCDSPPPSSTSPTPSSASSELPRCHRKREQQLRITLLDLAQGTRPVCWARLLARRGWVSAEGAGVPGLLRGNRAREVLGT